MDSLWGLGVETHSSEGSEWELSSGTFPSHGLPKKERGALSVLALLTAGNLEDFGISVESGGASWGATVAS